MIDTSTDTIKDLFYRQVKELTMKTHKPGPKLRLFDYQFSDRWI